MLEIKKKEELKNLREKAENQRKNRLKSINKYHSLNDSGINQVLSRVNSTKNFSGRFFDSRNLLKNKTKKIILDNQIKSSYTTYKENLKPFKIEKKIFRRNNSCDLNYNT